MCPGFESLIRHHFPVFRPIARILRVRFVRPLLFAAAALAVTAAGAQQRVIPVPEDAKRGELRHVHEMLVEIDGVRELLAPGVQIRDPANRLVVPSAVPPASPVRYVRNESGRVHRVWILTAEEAAAR